MVFENLISFFESLQPILFSLGYLGVFLSNLFGSATIIFPLPAFAVTFAFGGFLNPILVGLIAGVGAAIGEFTGYFVGRGGKKIIRKRWKNIFKRGESWFKKHKEAFPLIVLFAATPLPDDIIGILCGMFNYNFKKFFIAMLIGKIIMNLVLAFGGFYGISFIANIFGA